MTPQQGILLCGHGSRDPRGTAAFRGLVSAMQSRHPDKIVDYGFLEFAHPVYAAAVERMYRQGVRRITALPVILFAGGHAKNDIPYEMNTLQQQYPDLRITMGRHLGITPQLLQLSRRLIEEAGQTAASASTSAHPQPGMPSPDRSDTCLLVVGRGTADPDANSDVAKLTRMLWEGLGFGFATTAFIGVTTPLLKDALPLLENLPFRRVVVLPVFLFTGVLLQRIEQQIDEHRASSKKEYLCTASYGSDELLLQVLDNRIAEATQGDTAMNCQLCKYRTQIVGFEQDAGAVQVGHHLGVKGILFEEDERPGRSKGVLPALKKILGI
jgi:sirohydrochlorin cobaltochelatase